MNKNIYKGNRYVPKFIGIWDYKKLTTYESLSIVQWQGLSFTSKKDVPIGVDIYNENYWVITGNYNFQVENYRKEVKRLHDYIMKYNDYIELIEENSYYVKLKTGVSNSDFNSNLINNLIKLNQEFTSTDINNAPIVINSGGCSIKLPKGRFYIKNIVISENIKIEGSNKFATELIISDSIEYKKIGQNGFQAVWGVQLKDLMLTGVRNNILLKPSKYEIGNREEHILTESYFENLIFNNAKIGVDLRGWNNEFNACYFRDCEIGLNLTSAKTKDKTYVANAGDNLFLRNTFNNCSISCRMSYSYGNSFISCAFYQADYYHLLLGENSRGNNFNGGRLEDSTKNLALLEGGNVVKFNDENYLCIKSHKSSQENKPFLGESWEEYWKKTELFEGLYEWEESKNYNSNLCINNVFSNVNFYIGKESRPGRNNIPLLRDKNFSYIKLNGDQFTNILNCYSGSYYDGKCIITDLSINANLNDNNNLSVKYEGNKPTYFNNYTEKYGSLYKSCSSTLFDSILINGNTDNISIKKMSNPKSLSIVNEKTNKRIVDILDDNNIVTLNANKTSITLDKQKTFTIVSFPNLSSTNFPILSPSNENASKLSNVWARCESNDKIRIYHESVDNECTFNILVV